MSLNKMTKVAKIRPPQAGEGRQSRRVKFGKVHYPTHTVLIWQETLTLGPPKWPLQDPNRGERQVYGRSEFTTSSLGPPR